jgi:hypothetical protein
LDHTGSALGISVGLHFGGHSRGRCRAGYRGPPGAQTFEINFGDERLLNFRADDLNVVPEAMDTFGLEKGMILTHDQQEERETSGKKISMLPVWKWLLQKMLFDIPIK